MFDLPILLHAKGEQVDIPFREDARLKAGDGIVILTTGEKLANLSQRNKESHQLMLEGYLASK